MNMKIFAQAALYVSALLFVAAPLLGIVTLLIDRYAGAPFPVGLILGIALFNTVVAVWLIRSWQRAGKIVYSTRTAKRSSLSHSKASSSSVKSKATSPRHIHPELHSFMMRMYERISSAKEPRHYGN